MTTKIKTILLCACLVFALLSFTACTNNGESVPQPSVSDNAASNQTEQSITGKTEVDDETSSDGEAVVNNDSDADDTEEAIVGDNTNNDSETEVNDASNKENPVKTEGDLDETELAKIVAANLNVPEKAGITYEISEKYYWEAGQMYFKNVSFYENGDLVAGASADPRNGELLRNINLYSVDNK